MFEFTEEQIEFEQSLTISDSDIYRSSVCFEKEHHAGVEKLIRRFITQTADIVLNSKLQSVNFNAVCTDIELLTQKQMTADEVKPLVWVVFLEMREEFERTVLVLNQHNIKGKYCAKPICTTH